MALAIQRLMKCHCVNAIKSYRVQLCLLCCYQTMMQACTLEYTEVNGNGTLQGRRESREKKG